MIGQIADTNSQWMAERLGNIGIAVNRIHSISDRGEEIISTLEEVSSRADLILITGGLGPTKDDLTKKTLADYFEMDLIQDDAVLTQIKGLFEKLGYPFTRLNNEQALVPSGAEVLSNHWGTAPGMWFEGDPVVVSLPGVPFEMKELMKAEVLPRLEERFELQVILHKNILTYGIGESMLAELIEPWEDALPKHIGLAYLPSYGSLKLRLTAKGAHREVLAKEIEILIEQLQTYLSDYIVGYDEGETLEHQVGQMLIKEGKTLALAESCTGGKIAQMFTANAGASAYFKAGLVAYSPEIKIQELDVDPHVIDTYSVVSAQVAEAMAEGIRKKMGTDFGLATTGNAGPTTDKTAEDLGIVYVAVSCESGSCVNRFSFGQPREKVVNKAVTKAFEMLLEEILKNNK